MNVPNLLAFSFTITISYPSGRLKFYLTLPSITDVTGLTVICDISWHYLTFNSSAESLQGNVLVHQGIHLK